MKKQTVIIMMCCIASLASAGYVGTVLFSDSYDRPNNTNISASSVGMAGTLSPLVYVEAFEGSGQPTSIQIFSNQLNVAMGPGMGSLFVDHNFTDTNILTAGGFSISMAVVSITTADDTGNRYGGFGVGNTRDEAVNAKDSFDSLVPFRPNLARANMGIGVSDFYVDLALDQQLRLWSKGNLLNTINVGVAAGTIRVDFLVPDFNAGSVVTAVVYLNGVQKDVRTFTWDHTGANYVGISGRTAAAGVFQDNLSIATCYSEKAQNPVPASSTVDVVPETLVLQWNKGKDASGNPNANIAQHYLYIVAGEPNFVGKTPVTVANTADPITHTASLVAMDTDKTFYWRVDESVLVSGNPSGPADGNTITGLVWEFETIKSVPIIVTQPANQLVDAGQTATFTLSVSSISTPHYQWYKSADNANNTPGDDTPAGTDAASLAIVNAQIGNEGFYFCVVNNDSGTPAASNTAFLEIKRLMAWYAFEDNINDSSGNGYNGAPIKADANVPFTYVPGKVTQAITLNGMDEAVEIPRTIQNSMTIELWVKTTITGTTGPWYNGRGLVDGDMSGAQNDFGTVLLGSKFGFGVGNPDTTISSISNINDNQWHYCVATRDFVTGTMTVYVDGRQEATVTGPAGTKNAPTALRIGSLLGAINYLAGQIDEVKLYNYPLSELTVATQYNTITGESVCILSQRPNSKYDINGDCIVNLGDFAVFASGWLNCGYYPQTECP